MICPNCGTRLGCFETRQSAQTRSVHRKYRCSGCGTKYSSTELLNTQTSFSTAQQATRQKPASKPKPKPKSLKQVSETRSKIEDYLNDAVESDPLYDYDSDMRDCLTWTATDD